MRRRRIGEWIPACKEMSERTIHLLVAGSNMLCNKIITVCPLLRLRLHLPRKFWSRREAINNVDSNYWKESEDGERFVFPGKDMARLSCVYNRCFGIGVGALVCNGEL